MCQKDTDESRHERNSAPTTTLAGSPQHAAHARSPQHAAWQEPEDNSTEAPEHQRAELC